MKLNREESKWQGDMINLKTEIVNLDEERKRLQKIEIEHLHNKEKLSNLYDEGVIDENGDLIK